MDRKTSRKRGWKIKLMLSVGCFCSEKKGGYPIPVNWGKLARKGLSVFVQEDTTDGSAEPAFCSITKATDFFKRSNSLAIFHSFFYYYYHRSPSAISIFILLYHVKSFDILVYSPRSEIRPKEKVWSSGPARAGH